MYRLYIYIHSHTPTILINVITKRHKGSMNQQSNNMYPNVELLSLTHYKTVSWEMILWNILDQSAFSHRNQFCEVLTSVLNWCDWELVLQLYTFCNVYRWPMPGVSSYCAVCPAVMMHINLSDSWHAGVQFRFDLNGKWQLEQCEKRKRLDVVYQKWQYLPLTWHTVLAIKYC